MKRLLVKIAAIFALFCGVVLLALLPVSYPSGGIAFAQVNNPVIIIVGNTPTACNTLPLQIVAGTASLYGTNGSGGCTQISGPGSGAVTSVFGRTGAVTANTGDYTAAKVTNALDLSASGTQTMVGSLSIAVGQSIDVPIIRSQDGPAAATLLAGRWTYGASSALSTPTAIYTGSPIATGGSGTTTWPMVLMQPTGTTTTTWSTAGTFFGINAPSGFAGNLFDFQFNGTSRASLSAGGTLNALTSNATLYHTSTVCASAASPAVCAAAAAGSVAVAGSASTLVVDTTAVTANSQIMLTQDSSLGTRLSVTCDTTADLPTVSARTAGTSFTITTAVTVGTNPECISYSIVN